MAKKDYYIIEKNLNRIMRGDPTNFLDPLTYKKIVSKLSKTNYSVYYPYEDSEKVIIYTKTIPALTILEIVSNEPLTHRAILGSLYGLGLDGSLFGDIIITDNHYYLIVIDSIADLIKNELTKIGNTNVTIKDSDVSVLTDYHHSYQEIEIIISSLRIDNIVASLIGTSRENVKKEFLSDNVTLNYEICHKVNYPLKPNDIFSIRRYGKYKFDNIIKETKKGNFLVKIYKYIEK